MQYVCHVALCDPSECQYGTTVVLNHANIAASRSNESLYPLYIESRVFFSSKF